jgi:hypothetical protein
MARPRRAASMRSVTSYTVRKSALEPPTRYTIGDEALEIEPEGKPPRRVVYAELRRVTLSFVPTPVDARFFCSLRHAGGTLHLVSTNYDGPGSFSTRAAAYAPFVRALLARLADRAPQAEYRAGSGGLAYGLMIFFAVAMVPLAVGALLWWWQSDSGGVGALKALGVLFLLPIAVRWLKKNKPGAFDPLDPPAGLLPPA